jgi:OOP family OmpA-OmpF porin
MDEECKFDQLELALFHSNNADYKNSNLETDINLLSLNAIKEYKLNDTFNLYALAGIGYEQIKDRYFGNESDPFGNYGVGIKAKLHEKVSLKLDARHLLKFDGDRNIMYTLGLVFPLGEKASQAPQETPQPVATEPKPTLVEKEPELAEEKVAQVETKATQEIIIEPIDLGVHFDTDSAKIRQSDLEKFYPFVEYAKYIDEGKIVVEAHTDDIGAAKYNMGLSHRRAQSVKKQLIQMGVEADRIITKGYGETRPKVENSNDENRQINRRVEAKVIK